MSEPEPYAVGTFVKVRDSALSESAEYSRLNRNLVAEYGVFWIVDTVSYGDGGANTQRYLCRSMTTGVKKRWIHYELEAYGEQADEGD